MPLNTLKEYFKSGDAQAERDIRKRIFFETDQYAEISTFSFGKLKILISPKGVGKSCLIEEAHSKLLDQGLFSLLITPAVLDVEAVDKSSALSSKSKIFEEQLTTKISQLLLDASKDISLSNSNHRELLKQAINDSENSSSNLGVRIAKFLQSLSPHSDRIVKAIMEFDGYSTSSTANSVNDLITNNNQLYLFMDDIDRAAAQKRVSGNERASLNYTNCWAIIDALYQLTLSIPSINTVVCVRSDIWHTMERQGLGSDRRDKINDIIRLKMSDEDIEKILIKRLDAAYSDLPSNFKTDTNPFFESRELLLPGKKEITRKWTSFLAKTSRNKPRELILFFQLLLKEAKDKKISANHAYSAMKKYGKDVLKRSFAEFADICPSLETITNVVLRKQVYEFDDYLKTIKTTPSIRRIEVDGKTMTAGDVASAIEIMRVLHMANIVNPRVYDFSQKDKFSHIDFYESPEFVSYNNLQDLQKCQWEVHPAFYSMMDNQKKNGLPTKAWKK